MKVKVKCLHNTETVQRVNEPEVSMDRADVRSNPEALVDNYADNSYFYIQLYLTLPWTQTQNYFCFAGTWHSEDLLSYLK